MVRDAFILLSEQQGIYHENSLQWSTKLTYSRVKEENLTSFLAYDR